MGRPTTVVIDGTLLEFPFIILVPRTWKLRIEVAELLHTPIALVFVLYIGLMIG